LCDGRADWGSTLNEVRALLALSSTDGQSVCAAVRDISATHLADVRARLADLQAMERVLATVIRQCDAGQRPGCPLIDTLSGSADILRGGAPILTLEERNPSSPE
jgi:MerR family mercuric resistance operon transcriptional regulator